MMPGEPFFHRRSAVLWVEDLPLSMIGETYGTPCYVYSRAALASAFASFNSVLQVRPHLICYAVKANSNLAILNLFARFGAGFDYAEQWH